MSDTPKLNLYTVTVTFEFAVLAENEQGARSFTDEAADDIHTTFRSFATATLSDGCLPCAWEGSDFVYGSHEENVSFAEAVEKYVPAERRLPLRLKEAMDRAKARQEGGAA